MRKKVTFALVILSLIASVFFAVSCRNTTSEACVHSGGAATCIKRAVCEKCGEEYGELASHTYGEWQHDAEKHWKECTTEGCTVKTENGNHEGGKATCKQKAKCVKCGIEYGELADHSGGTATCTKKAVCDECNEEYGELAEHNYSEQKHDATGHWKECVCGATTEKESHTFNKWVKDDSAYDYKICECGEQDDTVFDKTVSETNQKLLMSGTEFSLNLDGVSEYASVESVKFGDTNLGNDITALSVNGTLKDVMNHGEQTFIVTVKGDDGESHKISVSVVLVTKEISSLADFLASCRYYCTDIYGYYVLTKDISYTEGFGSAAAAATRAWDGDKKGFKGTFDGQGHTITWKNGFSHGAFGALYGATIKNVTFAHAWYNGDWGGTAVAFSATDTTFENVKITIACNPTTKTDSAPIIDEMAGCTWKNCEISSVKSVGILIKIAKKSNRDSIYENVKITAVYDKFSTDIESFESVAQTAE